jgi:hypothetical protein
VTGFTGEFFNSERRPHGLSDHADPLNSVPFTLTPYRLLFSPDLLVLWKLKLKYRSLRLSFRISDTSTSQAHAVSETLWPMLVRARTLTRPHGF